jgi:predicted pyridoxine 5'-phosphate oxidase superfamily flavin-nucleotide-binding protein
VKLKVYSLFDVKIGAYNRPLFYRTDGEALRAFMDALEKDEGLKRHPEDYVMFVLGSFDDATGAFDCVPAPVSIGKGHELAGVDPNQLRLVK